MTPTIHGFTALGEPAAPAKSCGKYIAQWRLGCSPMPMRQMGSFDFTIHSPEEADDYTWIRFSRGQIRLMEQRSDLLLKNPIGAKAHSEAVLSLGSKSTRIPSWL